MSLVNITPDADGTTLTLRIAGKWMPCISGTVNMGKFRNDRQLQEINVQNQLINAPASVLAPSDVDIPLQLKGISVEQLDLVATILTCYAVKPTSGRFRPATSSMICCLRFITQIDSKSLQQGESQYNSSRMCVNVNAINSE